MDEIDYFPKRDKYKTQKDVGSDWNKLKKQKTTRSAKTEPPESSKTKPPQSSHADALDRPPEEDAKKK